MDIMKALEEKKELIKGLIEKTEDEKEIKQLNEKLLGVVDEIAEEKAKATYEAKLAELEEKQVKEAKAAKELKDVHIEVGNPAEYKGVNLKKAAYIAGMKNPDIAKTNKENPELCERLVKTFTDMASNAMERPNPMAKAMTGGTGTAGGYLTETDERMEVIQYMRKSSVALQDATVIQMSTDTMTFPVENAKVTVALRSEGSAVTASSPTFTQATLNTVNFDGYTDASKELVMDSNTLIATLMSQFAEAGGQKIDSAAFRGTGSPVSGVFTAAAGYSEVFSTGSSNFSALLSSNLDGIIGKVMATPQDTAKLKWYVHPTVAWRYLKTLKDSDGNYLYMNTALDEGSMSRLLGFPVRFVYEAPAATGASTVLAGFGDLSGMYIGERLNTMQLFYDPYTDAANGNDRFYWYTRWAFDFPLPNKFGRIVTAS